MTMKNDGQYNDVLLNRNVMKAFPKVELHRHLEGTFHLPTLHAIAMRNGIDCPHDFENFKKTVQFPRDNPPDFLLFLSKFKNHWYRSFDDIEEITYKSLVQLKEEGIVYEEIRFSPEHFSLQNDFNRMDVSRLIIDAGKRAAKDAGFDLRFLITFNRAKQTEEEMLNLYRDLQGLKEPSIVGIDLAGDELNYPPQLFQGFFDQVKADAKYGITVHAGEVSPPEQIWLAIDKLHANRIGHGTTSISDQKLQDYLIEKKVTLEQCITSNFQTGSWTDKSTHPLGRLFKRGVPVTINTDDPHIQDSDLVDDYLLVAKNFGFGLEDFISINLLALEGSFLSPRDKTIVKDKYLKACESFKTTHIPA